MPTISSPTSTPLPRVERATGASAVSSMAVTSTEPSFGELVQDASRNFSTLLHAEIELAKTEITGSVKKGVTGIVFFAAAAVVLVFSLVFLLIAAAEGLVALGVIRWLAYLIVWFVLVLVAAVAAFLGLRTVKKVRKPERTIETMKDNKGLLQRDTAGIPR